jgi:hypothetical protein
MLILEIPQAEAAAKQSEVYYQNNSYLIQHIFEIRKSSSVTVIDFSMFTVNQVRGFTVQINRKGI